LRIERDGFLVCGGSAEAIWFGDEEGSDEEVVERVGGEISEAAN
jgi:hypothetical protein